MQTGNGKVMGWGKGALVLRAVAVGSALALMPLVAMGQDAGAGASAGGSGSITDSSPRPGPDLSGGSGAFGSGGGFQQQAPYGGPFGGRRAYRSGPYDGFDNRPHRRDGMRSGLDCPYGASSLSVPCQNIAPSRPRGGYGRHHSGRRGYGSFCREVVAEDCVQAGALTRCRPRRIVVCE